jgi:hypothetical protein
MHKYTEGESVALIEDHPRLGLKAGNSGRVWALYAVDPPTYEVTFTDVNGDELDLTVSEDEIGPLPAQGPVRRPCRQPKVRAR